MGDRKSPYLILGVPYGATKNDAARAFAQATRRLRRHPDAPYDLEDLNWALHAIEQRIQDPATSIDDFRVPAETSVYQIPAGEGLLNPPVTRYRRRTIPPASTELDHLHNAVLVEIAEEIATECRNNPLPVLHYFPGSTGLEASGGPTVRDAKVAASTSSRSRDRLRNPSRTLGVVAAVLVGIAIVVSVVMGIVAALSSAPGAGAGQSSPPISVTPAAEDTAAMVFHTQFATDERAYEVCEDSCWIWDVTPSESCEEAQIDIGMYLSEDATESSVARTHTVGRLAKGVVKRVVVPTERDDPEFAKPLRLACGA